MRLIALFCASMAACPALAQNLWRPVRLTAGGSNQYMGVPSPDGRSVYYVTDRGVTTEVMRLDLERGGPRLAAEVDADATSPRVSPDGKLLVFVSFREDSTGDVCTRALPDGEVRCLTDQSTADSQPFFFPDGRSVGVVQRQGIHGELALRRIPIGEGRAETLVPKGVSAPAVSPDGVWLAWAPVERQTERVGVAFAMRAGRGIALARHNDPRPPWVPDLPGASGSPAFSADGRWLYFVQYLNDTNRDGVSDGDDNGVVFRVPFDSSKDPPIGTTMPEQVTSAAWNCRYPAPGKDRLLVTCSHEGALDVYWLPLEGAVPATWGQARIAEEVEASRDHYERLLLLGRALPLLTDPAARVETLRRMAMLHIELAEFESAAFYARAVLSAVSPTTPVGEWARVTLELVAHRSAEVRLVQGQLSETFIQSERERLERLRSLETPEGRVLGAMLRSEILDILGEEGAALAAFREASVADCRDPFVLLSVAERAMRLLSQHGLKAELLALLSRLASHEALSRSERLRLADDFARVLTRGQKRADAMRLVEEWSRAVPEGSELAFRLAVEQHLLQVGSRPDDEVRRELFETYKAARDLELRRLLVARTVTRAALTGHEGLAYEFANSYVSFVKRGQAERSRAEGLYRAILMDRAYDALAKGRVGDARADFFGVTLQVDDLEAHGAFIVAWAREGKGDVREAYKRYPADSPIKAFVDAWLLGREVAAARDVKTLDDASERLLSRLATVQAAFPRAFEVHYLRGFVAHHRYLWKGRPEDAVEAQACYEVALDLAAGNTRAQATARQALGLLLADLGNHATAAMHLRKRLALPFRDKASELAVRLALARSLFLWGREAEAATEAAQAKNLVDQDSSLARFLPLVLDRAALYALAASDGEAALALYDRLEKALPADSGPVTRLKFLIGRGTAALIAGKPRATDDLEAAHQLLLTMGELPPEPSQFPERPARNRVFGRDDYLILLAGLRAAAFRANEQFAQAQAAMEERQSLLTRRYKRLGLDEDCLDLAGVHYHLAEYAYRTGDKDTALRETEEGLAMAARFEELTGTALTKVRVALVKAYAELHVVALVPLAKFRRDLAREVQLVYDNLTVARDPAFEPDRVLLGTYLALLRAEVKR